MKDVVILLLNKVKVVSITPSAKVDFFFYSFFFFLLLFISELLL